MFSIEPSTEISHRTDFSLLCNARGYLDAVEVGVDMGVFARDFLSRFSGNWVWLIDPYEPYPEFPYDRIGDQIVAAQTLAPFHGRFRFIRLRSVDVAPWITQHIQPSFIYIDGSHKEEDVRADMEAWWAILPENGCLAGHDMDVAHPGVMQAVERFAREKNVVVRTTHETIAPPSWYIYKTEPQELMRLFFDSSGSMPNPYAVNDA